MFKEKDILFLYAETPLHPGAGAGLGFIDLPLQRERFTGLPIIQGSGMKGSIREFFECQPGARNPSNKLIQEILDTFGPEAGEGASEYAGAITISDARVLLFPVRSLYGVFAYLTCPLILNRFKRDLDLAGQQFSPLATIPDPKGDNICVISNDNDKSIIAQAADGKNWSAVFDEFAFSAQLSPETRSISAFIRDYCFPKNTVYNSWKSNFPSRFAIVPDDVFADFTCIGAEVISRNKVGKTGAVSEEDGDLWTEEHMPSETLLYCILLASDPLSESKKSLLNAKAVKEFLKSGIGNSARLAGLNNQRLQIGGDKTVGRGITMTHFLSNGGKS